MLPSSDALEEFEKRVRKADKNLAKPGTARVNSKTIEELSLLAKDWMRLSAALASSDACDKTTLGEFDEVMLSLLNVGVDTRASSCKKKIQLLIAGLYPNLIVPVIKFEASPAEVARRDLLHTVSSQVTPNEAHYVDEAARCMSLRCHRAAIIMLWAAGIARLHAVIQQMGFPVFNSALSVAVTKKGHPFNKVVQNQNPISSLPELQRMSDYAILVVGIELWKYDLQFFQELERLLGIRNDAAHPGMSNPDSLDVLQFARKLNDFVFAKIRLD